MCSVDTYPASIKYVLKLFIAPRHSLMMFVRTDLLGRFTIPVALVLKSFSPFTSSEYWCQICLTIASFIGLPFESTTLMLLSGTIISSNGIIIRITHTTEIIRYIFIQFASLPSLRLYFSVPVPSKFLIDQFNRPSHLLRSN